MADRIVENEQERQMLIKFVQTHKLPFTATVTAGKHRTTLQNKLQRLWVKEISEQLGDQTAEEVRGYCKLHIGVPLLREENEAFRKLYDEIIRPMPYEHKLKAMMVPLDMPITRIMTTRQKKTYLDSIHREFSERGIILTDPEALERGQTVRRAA